MAAQKSPNPPELPAAQSASQLEGPSPQPGRSRTRRLAPLIFMAVWTILVALALWWLLKVDLQKGGDTSWVLHHGGAPQQSFVERTRDWFRLAHLNFQRIYPWVFLAPYVAWLTSRFWLERERLRSSLPVHLAACALFAFVSYQINARTSMRVSRIVVVTSHGSIEGNQGFKGTTNLFQMEVSGMAGAEITHEQKMMAFDYTNLPQITSAPEVTPKQGPVGVGVQMFSRPIADGHFPDVLALGIDRSAHTNITNLFPEFVQNGAAPIPPPGLPSMRPLTTVLDVFAYCAIVGISHSVHFYRRYRERERRALFLESNLAKARLGALQAQLQPHFLFNSLNAIAALLRRDPALAESTLTSLSELLRLALSQSDKQQVSLREELQFVERYLDIQQTRFGDRLRFEQNVEPATLDCLVPTLLLQPLVENAIRHGIEPSETACLVRLTARREKDFVVLLVEDDGVGLSSSIKTASSSNTGIGLANLRARLEALYGSNQKLDLTSRPGGGVLVRVEIPFSPATLPRTSPEAERSMFSPASPGSSGYVIAGPVKH